MRWVAYGLTAAVGLVASMSCGGSEFTVGTGDASSGTADSGNSSGSGTASGSSDAASGSSGAASGGSGARSGGSGSGASGGGAGSTSGGSGSDSGASGSSGGGGADGGGGGRDAGTDGGARIDAGGVDGGDEGGGGGDGGAPCGFTLGTCPAGEICCPVGGPVPTAEPYGCYVPTASQPTCPPTCAPKCVSDRNVKRDIEPVDERAVLESVARMPVSTWSYKSDDPSVRHMGPMAQDFRAAFGLGDTDRAYDSVDAHGVTLAAIKGL